ncbi:MAG: sterol desaturase family protein [Stenotrophomonas sp.]|uniref:sterol desaturase family protein n=1 Tax=Stenotrophomonas sp. TaxID=69392 RepID=UPI0013533BB4|nr:sterol desaturase family protein [Stenotrophomonas sp.]MTI74873.1 sterol desaturase family protein [Stenotrophomonas sp.]
MDEHAWAPVAWLADHVVTPILQRLGRHDDPRDIAVALLLTALQLTLIAGVFRPLESLWPAERWHDRRLTRVDRTYTLLMLLGLFPLFSYLVLAPLASPGGDVEAVRGPHGLRAWVPWFEQHPWLLFGVYYLLYDFVYYWMHRAQHAIPWWWALHSLHHSQRQLSCWSNDRGSWLDGMLQSLILAGVGLLAGVEVDEFAVLMLIGELVQNYSHTNIRFGFGRWGSRVVVDPIFHRLHHMVMDPQRPGLHNRNFGQVFALWDVLFGTSLYGEPIRPTGVADPVVDADNQRGVLAMQWHAVRRFWGTVRRPLGWKFGEVAFSEDCEPIAVGHDPAERALDQPVPDERDDARQPSREQ